ncbi:MAG: aminotransferase class V-fold PLP-dependent enzyme [Candidatus Omnitrophica bacterium]|nr:aminotransferase class V-fold PLP-dependent enzyme [Candidatus Omnitrophota bacterium]
MARRQIYMDHNATTPLHPEVKKALREGMELYGNPSSLHSFGRKARHMIEESRGKVASFINADPEEVIFVGSGSEANNTVLSMLMCPSKVCSCGNADMAGREIITTSIEHPCIMRTSECLQDRGVPIKYLSVDQYGKIDFEELAGAITGRTGLVSVMMANNEIGTVQDIKETSRIVREKGVLFHTDAVQAAGKMPVDVRELDVDFLTLSGHKIYGPKGIGALYVRKGTPFCPLIRGGHQEQGRRAGTENTLGIVGMGKAVEARGKEMNTESKRHLQMKRALKEGLAGSIPDIRFNGHPTDSLANTLNMSFKGAEGEAILLYLDEAGVAVSTGSACASGSLDPSHVLIATGVPVEQAHGSIRVSLGRGNTMKDIDYLLEVFPPIIKKIRDMSSAYKRES